MTSRAGTGLAEISRRLGYRFTLDKATVPRTVYAGGAMHVSLSFTNKGFGKLYNARPLQIVFSGQGGQFAATALADARRKMPLGGDSARSTSDSPRQLGWSPDRATSCTSGCRTRHRAWPPIRAA